MARTASKRRRRKVTVSDDRISDLPDPLICHILSFLPTKQVIAISFLSKRWKSIWLSITAFDFDCAAFKSPEDFLLFVDSVLFMTDSKPVEKFRLKCKGYDLPHLNGKVDRIDNWINTLIQREVENLELRSDRLWMQLPSRIFNCETIKVLKLYGVRVNTFYSVNLPLLRVLELFILELRDPESLENLLSRCPLLQDLVLRLGMNIVRHITLDIEKLQHLVSATVPLPIIKLKAFADLTFLRLNWDESYGHEFPSRFENLTRIEFSFLLDEDLNGIVVEGLRNCHKLEVLVIDEIFVFRRGLMKPMEPILDVPQCVSSHLKEFRLGRYEGLKFQFEFVKFIMKNARALRAISICSFYRSPKTKYRMIQRLSSCPRGSENCKLLFR